MAVALLSSHEKRPPNHLSWRRSSHWDLNSQPAGVGVSCGTAWQTSGSVVSSLGLGWNTGRWVYDVWGCSACCRLPLSPQVAPRCRFLLLQPGKRLLQPLQAQRLLQPPQVQARGSAVAVMPSLGRTWPLEGLPAPWACCSEVHSLLLAYLLCFWLTELIASWGQRRMVTAGVADTQAEVSAGSAVLRSWQRCIFLLLLMSPREKSPLQGTQALDKWKKPIKSICKEIADALEPSAQCNIKLPVMSVTLHSCRHR